jgi:N-acetylmuramoyl-L-alanine amidase
MKKFRVVVLNKRFIYVMATAAVIVILASISIFYASSPANIFADPKSGIVVIDPGHGGVDGGTNKDGILEKEVNLAIAKKLKTNLEQKLYRVVMTREEDVSLDGLSDLDASRHQKDLQARADIINSSNAQLFISIHVNCNFNRPATDGSIVFYSDRFSQNRELAYTVQSALNSMFVNGRSRTVHDPQTGEFFILKYSDIPGVIVETAFISNEEERKLLLKEEFQEQLTSAIGKGVEKYLNGIGSKQVRHHEGR